MTRRSRARRRRSTSATGARPASSGDRSRARRRDPARPGRRSCERHSSRGPLPLRAQTLLERDRGAQPSSVADPRRVGARAALVAGHGGRAVDRRACGPRCARAARSPRSATPRARRRRCRCRCRAPSPRPSRRRRRRRTSSRGDWSPSPKSSNVVAGRERVDDPRERHVGPLPRAERVEVAQHDAVEPELAPVRSGEVLAGELRDPVGRERLRRRLLRRRIALGGAVDRRRRREDDPHAVARGRLEHALRGEHVPAQVEREDVAEAADARLARRGGRRRRSRAKSSSSSARSSVPDRRARGRSPPSAPGRSSR